MIYEQLKYRDENLFAIYFLKHILTWFEVISIARLRVDLGNGYLRRVNSTWRASYTQVKLFYIYSNS